MQSVPVSFAKPCKMFGSHKINLVSANYLESVTWVFKEKAGLQINIPYSAKKEVGLNKPIETVNNVLLILSIRARTTLKNREQGSLWSLYRPACDRGQPSCNCNLPLLSKRNVKGLESVSKELSILRAFLNNCPILIWWCISKHLHILIVSNMTVISLVSIYVYSLYTNT